MEKENLIVIIVAIVAIVGIVALVIGANKGTNTPSFIDGSSENMAGNAITYFKVNGIYGYEYDFNGKHKICYDYPGVWGSTCYTFNN